MFSDKFSDILYSVKWRSKLLADTCANEALKYLKRNHPRILKAADQTAYSVRKRVPLPMQGNPAVFENEELIITIHWEPGTKVRARVIPMLFSNEVYILTSKNPVWIRAASTAATPTVIKLFAGDNSVVQFAASKGFSGTYICMDGFPTVSRVF